MLEKVELLGGALRFSPFCFLLDVIVIIHFFVFWRHSYKKTGWKIDYWFFTLSLLFFLPVFLIYPFSASYANYPVIGDVFFFAADPFIDKAFIISLVGYFSLWVGRFFFDRFSNQCFLDFTFRCLSPVCKSFEKNLTSFKSAFFLFFCCVFLEVVILFIAYTNGCFFNPRSYFLKTGQIRPLYNLTVSFFSFAIGFSSIRYLQYKSRRDKYLLFLLFVFSFFLGIRGVIIGGVANFVLFSALMKQGKIGFVKLFALGVMFFILAIYIDVIRYGNFNFFEPYKKFFFNLLYGNNFSDVRDFGIVLGLWDNQFVFGKTYLAGLISFIPRILSPFREEWSLSVFTNKRVGLDSNLHAGLRPGFFGESYFNFGIFGVILVGIIIGYAIRFIDMTFKKDVTQRGYGLRAYSLCLNYVLLSCLFISVGFWAFYSMIVINCILSLVRRYGFSSRVTYALTQTKKETRI